ncbi:glycosyltransferase [Geobacter hydrogenophilus]|uniref:Glycosyl transferase family 1 domain-containing protein n=1 Tax=Geobacter hydrogenophilus TaxID=40983 RepID=A0A9W6FXI1_9BACT|nr:glycosyltransferase [Geobacter hydrogenophilus]MBT0894925.1 glycosyltransferase [Geobacter hydrogenophilus]GLI36670.1 hypothetical protein GHYDROH2_01710 [Geobacter hydrogenophilus]
MSVPRSGSRILLIYNSRDRWVEDDIRILNERYRVSELFFDRSSFGKLIVFLFRALQLVVRCDAVVYWFASHYALVAALVAFVLRKPVAGIVSGYDMANRPDLGYGHLRGGINRSVVTATTSLSRLLFAVSDFTQNEVKKNLPQQAGKTILLHHGFHPQTCFREKKTYVLTACAVTGESLKLKGLELYLAVAQRFPTVQFVVAGKIDRQFVQSINIPDNVILAGSIKDFADSPLLQEAAVYMQLSEYESFGCAVAEAMLNECYPIVTRRGALPEVVGPCGDLVETDVGAISATLQSVLDKKPFPYKEARIRIEEVFPYSARRDKLLASMALLLKM